MSHAGSLVLVFLAVQFHPYRLLYLNTRYSFFCAIKNELIYAKVKDQMGKGNDVFYEFTNDEVDIKISVLRVTQLSATFSEASPFVKSIMSQIREIRPNIESVIYFEQYLMDDLTMNSARKYLIKTLGVKYDITKNTALISRFNLSRLYNMISDLRATLALITTNEKPDHKIMRDICDEKLYKINKVIMCIYVDSMIIISKT